MITSSLLTFFSISPKSIKYNRRYRCVMLYLLACMMFALLPIQSQALQSISPKPQKDSWRIRADVKHLKKEGWKPAPGKPDLAEQLKNLRSIYEIGELGREKYLVTNSVIGTSRDYNQARAQAEELAIQELAELLETLVKARTEVMVEDGVLSSDEAGIIIKTMMNSRLSARLCLKDYIPVMEIYRKVKSGNIEVLIRIACKSGTADSLIHSQMTNNNSNDSKKDSE